MLGLVLGAGPTSLEPAARSGNRTGADRHKTDELSADGEWLAALSWEDALICLWYAPAVQSRAFAPGK